MPSAELIKTIAEYDAYYAEYGATEELVNAYMQACHTAITEDLQFGLTVTAKTKKIIEDYILQLTGGTFEDLERYAQENDTKIELIEQYYDVLKIEAPHLLESFILYMEKERKISKRFYLPRRKVLKIVVDDLQELGDRKIKLYCLSMPPRVGKSTISLFFMAWQIGRRPNSHNAMGGHSDGLAKGFYKEILNFVSSAEYTFSDIFPNSVIQNKSAEALSINLDEPDRFDTFTARGIDGAWTGTIDISQDGILYVDDLIKDRQESLSPQRLNNKYQSYQNVMVDRKQDGAGELDVATRWGILDVIGRLKALYGDSPYARFREIPALNEKDESNFDYDGGIGFSTEHYKDLRNRLDANEWMAKYQQKPFVREGLLLPQDELNYFNGVLPDGEYESPSVIDPAFGGGDSLSMPIAKVVDGEVYIVDWVFNNSDKFVTRPLVVGAIMRNEVSRLQIEGNAGGTEYAEDIEKMLRDEDYSISIITPRAGNRQSKYDKIVQYAADIKRNFHFLSPDLQPPEYRKAMEEVCIYTAEGKNLHDDAIDSLVQLYQFVFKAKRRRTVIIDSMF